MSNQNLNNVTFGHPSQQILANFTIDSIPDLDVVVLGALALFEQTQLPRIEVSQFKRPLVVGSGNAEVTGRIVFAKTDAIFASESEYQAKLDSIPEIDGVILISASGGKHAPEIARQAVVAGKPVTLLTNTSNSPAEQVLEQSGAKHQVMVFPKNREPYTYNTSTYMGMILSMSGESSREIREYIEREINQIQWPDFASYSGFYLIVPPKFSMIIRMLNIKFIELFGRTVARDIETSEYVRHATTVVKANELFISFGQKNEQWGEPKNRLHIPLPENADYAAMMAIGYYVIGQIQKARPAYFKQNIADYTKFISEVLGASISPIVE
jgi:hypothetical protein